MAQAGSIPPRIHEAYTTEAMLPEGILKLSMDERFILWVELREGRLSLLEQEADGGLVIRRVIPISIGKNGFGKEREGDKRTPVGVYHFTNFLSDRRLIDFYGLGAYPLNYPSPLDLRLNKTGSGIWLHGLPKGIEQRPFLDSDGCIVIDNNSLEEMAEFIDTGVTHIVLTENAINWQSKQDLEYQSMALQGAVEDWEEAWEARDNDLYLSFYADSFASANQNKVQWDAYKRRVNNAKSSIDVDISKLSFFMEPETDGIVNVRYYQHYQSSNYEWNGWKEQLWQKQDNRWQIIYEGQG